jgi:hypothetical protein
LGSEISRSSPKETPLPVFDHFPIVLAAGRNNGGRKSFKFENMWLKEEGFVERVRGWWASYNFQGTPSFIFAKKLRALMLVRYGIYILHT